MYKKYIKLYLFIYIPLILPLVLSLEFKKNENLKYLPHNENKTNIINITSSQSLRKLFNKPKNIVVGFINQYCYVCKDLITALERASTYDFVNHTTQIGIANCYINPDICKDYNITFFPSIKVYLYNKVLYQETTYTPLSYGIDEVLEYIEKIAEPLLDMKRVVLKLKNMNKLKEFSNDYGIVSFLLIIDDNHENMNLLKCYKNIAVMPDYLPRYYFAYMKSNKYRNTYDINIPSILLTGTNYKDFNVNSKIDKCEDIIKFVNENQFPVFMHITKNYLNKLHILKKTIIILTLERQSISNVRQVMNLIQNIAVAKRHLIFGYLDINDDADLLQFFNIGSDSQCIIVYNFEIGKYYIDSYKQSSNINNVIDILESGKIKWKSGYIIEDTLNNIGLNVDRKVIMITTFIIASFIVIILCIAICTCLNYIDSKFKKD